MDAASVTFGFVTTVADRRVRNCSFGGSRNQVLQASEEGSLYNVIGSGYNRTRREDPKLYQRILNALGDSKTVVNIGDHDNYHAWYKLKTSTDGQAPSREEQLLKLKEL